MSGEKVALPRPRPSLGVPEVQTPADPSPSGPAAPQPTGLGRWLRGRRADLLAALCALVFAGWTTVRLWLHIHSRVLARNQGDHTFFQWMMAYGAHWLTHGGNPFHTGVINVPDGVNIAANTNVLALSVPLAPVTLLFGPDVAFAVLVTLGFALTAYGWYHVFSRYLVRSRVAALLGGLFCGFAPGLIAHANGQPNQVAQFVLPYLTLVTLRLHRRPLRNGIILGLLVTYQAFVNEEILFIAAIGLGLLVLLYAVQRRDEARELWRPYVRGLLTGAGTGIVLLAYPLLVQFTGPGAYHGLPFTPDRYTTDLFSFVTYPRQAIGGDPAVAARLSPSPDEDNASFGWPLLALAVVLAVWLWKRRLVRAAVGTGLVAAVLSLGPTLRVNGHATGIPLPYAVLEHVPPFMFGVPGRFALVCVPVIGMLLALGVEAVRESPLRYRLLWVGAVAGALVPLVPTPLHAVGRGPVPQFLASGEWRQYVPAGRTVVTVPLPSYQAPDPMYWQAVTGLVIPMPRGYFLGPDGPDGAAMFGAPPRPTATKLYAISILPKIPKPYVGGDTPLGEQVTGSHSSPLTVTDADRANIVDDLHYWRAAIVVLAPRKNDDKLRETVTRLLGYQPRWVDGVWLWDVRSLAG